MLAHSPSRLLPLVLLLAVFSPDPAAHAANLPSRWAHSLALLPSPEYTLIIASGKLDTSGQTYTSASTTATSILVPLTAAFSLADVDGLAQEVTAGPPYAWASVEALGGDGVGHLLAFGGDGSPGTAIQTGTDSAWLYSTSDGWAQQAADWAGEPMRREGAASCTLDQTTYFTAGSRADGSITPFLTTYAYTATNGFAEHSSTLPVGLLQPSLHCLSNGTLLLLGGYDTTASAVEPLSTAYTLDTTTADDDWQQVTLGGSSVPDGRRAALAVTFGSGSGLFLAGGGTGQNGLESVLDDAFVLDFATGEWQEVTPAGAGPGGRLGARGVAIGNSQVLFFGGYETNSAADGALYLYDLASNAYLDTFTPPSTWSTSDAETSASVSETAETAESTAASAAATSDVEEAILANAVASQTTTLAYTQTTTLQTVIPTVVTDAQGSETTSFLTSDVATSTITGSSLATLYEVTLSSGETSTVYPSAIAAAASSAVAAAGSTAEDEPWDPATYTGIIPGYATLTTSSGASATGSSSSDGSSSTDGSSTGSGSAAMSAQEKTAIGVGTTFGFLALAAVAVVFVVRKRKRPASGGSGDGDDDEKAGLAGGRSRDWAQQTGTWSTAFGGAAGATWNDFTGRERKRGRLYGRLSEKLAAGFGSATAAASGGAAAVAAAGRGVKGAAGGRRWGMLDDEDTRRYETYPPPLSRNPSQTDSFRDGDVEEAHETDPFTDDPVMTNRAGMGIFARSSSFAAPVPESETAEGDLGYGRLHDEVDDVVGNPFVDGAAVAGIAGGLKRSTATSNFYPNAYASPVEDYNSTPESSNPSYMSHRSIDDPSDRPHPSSVGQATFPPSSSFASTFYPQAPPPSRSNSNAGWRKVLGLNLRAKSPPLPTTSNLTHLPPSVLVMGSRMRDLRDPATPPVLGFDEDLEKGEWAGRRRKSFGQLGRNQEASSSSLTSARTATSDQFERFNHLDIVQRNRTASGSTATPEASPELESTADAPAFQFPPSLVLSSAARFEPLRDPFADTPPAEADLIALGSPAGPTESSTFARPSARPTGARPLSSSGLPSSARAHTSSPSLSTPSSADMTATASSSSSPYSATNTPGSFSPFSIDSLSPNPAFPTPTPPVAPPPIRRSVRDTIAAFEQHSTTEPLNITKKTHGPRGKKPSTSYTTVARPTLTLANPDSTPREPSD